jgi:hypothetical protein
MKNKLRIFTLILAFNVIPICNAEEPKKSKEISADEFSAIISAPDKVRLYIDGTKMELKFKGVTPQDSIHITQARTINNKNFLVAIVRKALKNQPNIIFMLEFSRDWKKVSVPFYGALKYNEHIPDKDTEFVKIFTIDNPENPNKKLHFIYIFATEQAYGNALYVFKLNLEKKLWHSFVKFPLLVEETVQPIEGYENAKIVKISQVSLEATHSPHLYKILVKFEVRGAQSGYPMTKTYEFPWFITKKDFE